MNRHRCTVAMLLGSLTLLPGLAGSQTPFNETGEGADTPKNTIGGKFTMDFVTIRSSMPGVPLRFGGVVFGSETVEFEGKRLVKSKDYQVDYDAGVLYLMRATKPGQIVRVSYRYDDKRSPQSVGRTQFAGMPTLKFDLVPGKMRAVVGFGMAERQADGNVLMSNLYGWNNDMGGLKGLMLVGDRAKVETESGYEYRDKPGETQTGKSRFILQNFATGFNGGSIEASYQDISGNFAGFSAVSESGYEQAFVDQLAKERGLKRVSFGMRDVRLGDGKVSNGFRQVRDGDASVDWRSFGYDSKTFKASWNYQSVDSDFKRFQDLGEADREQLRKEVGLRRQNFATSLGPISFSGNEIENADGGGVYRRSLALDTSRVSFSLGDQRIDDDFRRFDSLWENERGQWGREAGHERQWLALDAAIMGKEKQQILRFGSIGRDGAKFASTDVNVAAKGWSLNHTARTSDAGFGSMNAMNEGEMDAHIRAIATMYGPGVNTQAQDRGRFLQSAGIDRTYTKLAGAPFKGWQAQVDSMNIKGQRDDVDVTNFALTGPAASLSYRKQKVGEQFGELANLMEFERQRLGTIAGLERSDFGLTLNLSPKKQLAVATLNAQAPDGGVKRTNLTYKDPKIDVAVTTREVDPGFASINQLVDPERDLLAALRGFKERDAKVKWQINSNLKLDAFVADAQNDPLGQSSYVRNFVLNWNPDKRTQVEVVRMQQKQTDPLQVLFANLTEKITLARDLGRYGKILFYNETQDFEGKLTQNPDFKRQYVAYEAKLDARTNLRTEQTRTQFDNGDKEDISANTISTELSKKVGVSLTDMKVDRNGEDRDERKRNYGFWFDFGKGFRLTYGYARQINGPTGTMNSNLSLSSGTLDFLKIDAANYAENRWDGQHTQGLSNIAFGSSRPLKVGFLKDLTFNFAMDTATDWTNWVRENRMGSLGFAVGSNRIGLEYRGQMSANGYRGVDRTLTFETDKSEKRPLVGKFRISERSLPNDSLVTIRDVSLTYRPARGINVTHSLSTNPEDPQPRPDVPMFKNTNPWRVNKWTIGVDRDPRTSFAGLWEERLNDVTRESSRLTGLTLDLFKTSGSPLQLFYGIEQRWGNVGALTAHRYYIKYDQKAGPNQLFSLFAGNVSYAGALGQGMKKDNWTINLNYQWRF